MPTQYLDEQEELLEAVKSGREDRLRALLACGTYRLDLVDKDGRTPLHWACQYGHLPTVCLLLSHCSPEASPASSAGCLSCPHRSLQHDTPGISTHTGFSLHNDNSLAGTNVTDDVINKNVDDEVSKLGDSSICDVTLVPDRDSICNCRNSNMKTVHSLCTCSKGPVIQTGPDAGRQKDGSGKQPHTNNLVNMRDVKGHTALHVACNYRRADVASFLASLPCCDVNATDRVGNTPLHRAIHAGLHNLACLLCDVGADVRAANSQLWTPLHEAIRCGSEDVVRTLLVKGCNVNAMTSSVAATTPFLTAIFYYKISLRSSDFGKGLDTILRLLIEAGCKLSEGDYQWTPLSASIDIDKSFIASLLLFNGCRFQRTFSATNSHSQRGNKRGCTRSNSVGGGSSSLYGRSMLVEAFTRCEPYVVKLLVLCGYQPSLEEVDHCARRIPSFSPLFYRISRSEHAAMRGKTDLLHWLRLRARQPRTLMELSRAAVRVAANHASADTSILKRLQQLPLPTALRHYVSLSDFTHDLVP